MVSGKKIQNLLQKKAELT